VCHHFHHPFCPYLLAFYPKIEVFWGSVKAKAMLIDSLIRDRILELKQYGFLFEAIWPVPSYRLSAASC